MLRAYRYRIFPTEDQKAAIEKHIDCCRFIYNWGLEAKIKAYQKTGKSLTYFDLTALLTKLKQQSEFFWLNEVNAQSLQSSLRNLDNAFTAFFRKKAKFPKFRSKRKAKKSFESRQGNKVDFENQTISVIKIRNIPTEFHRTFEGQTRAIHIHKTTAEKYFASVLVETGEELPPKPPITEEGTVGIDLGLKTFATLSDGRKFDNPKHLKKSEHLLKKRHKQLSKKKKGSSNRNKARKKLALLYEKVTNQRKDFLHKVTKKLIDESQVNTFALETLGVANMLKNRHVSKAISDVGWYTFTQFLEYKSDWYGKNILRIGRFEPSSRLCTCGYHNQELSLKDRTWVCLECGTKHDRDILAACNIKAFALQKQNLIGTAGSAESKQKACGDDLGKMLSVKQETSHL